MSSSDETTTGTGDACISAEDLERARRDITSRGMLLSRQDSLSLIHEIEHLKRLVGTGRALFDAQAEQVGALITERNELRSLLVDRSPLFQDLEDAKAENARLRERVAELEGALVLHALPLADGLPCWCAGGWLEDGRHGAACLQSRAALAQAVAKDGPTIEWGDA